METLFVSLVTLVAAVGFLIGSNMAKQDIYEDCQKIQKTVIHGKPIECKPLPKPPESGTK